MRVNQEHVERSTVVLTEAGVSQRHRDLPGRIVGDAFVVELGERKVGRSGEKSSGDQAGMAADGGRKTVGKRESEDE